MKKIFIILSISSFALGFLSCQTKHEVEIAPVEVKPIHITIDVNVRIDKALDDFFGDIDEAEETIK